MKITKNQLKQIIKEEAMKLQKKTILENRRKEIVKELRMLNENVDEALNILKEEFKSQNYSELLDINKLSEEFGISTSDLKGYIDELQKDREEGDQRLRAERGAGFAPINAESARDSLISLLVRKGILVKAWNIDTKILIDKGVKPGPDFGKFIKDWTSNNAKKYMTPEKYAENIDIFFKERGY